MNTKRKAVNAIYKTFFDELANYVVYEDKLRIPTGLKEPYRSMSWEDRKNFFYSKIDLLNKELEPFTLCYEKCMKNDNGGCVSNKCCTLHPDLLGEEKKFIEQQQKVNEGTEFCSLLDIEKGVCSIYENRPLACRMYYNYTDDEDGCLDNNIMKGNKMVIYMFASKFLGNMSGTMI